jgi:hypothetical protein
VKRTLCALALALIPACEGETDATADPEPAAPTDALVQQPAASMAPASSCEELIARGREDDLDAALAVRLCPDREPTRRELRAALAYCDHPDEVAELLPVLDRDAELSGIARLIRRAPVTYETLPAPHDDPRSAIVSPASGAVLDQVDAAIANATRPRVGPGDRIRGRAYLAKTYAAAFHALGIDGGEPLPPFARRLAGHVLHWGVGFGRAQAIRPQRGYGRLLADIDLTVLQLVLHLQRGAWTGDDARLVLAWHDARQYLRTHAVRGRLDRALEKVERSRGEFSLDGEAPAGVERLFDEGVELDRLIDVGLVDLAIEHGARLARGGYGLGPVEAHLRARLGGNTEDLAALENGLDRLRRLRPPPPELGETAWETSPRETDTQALSTVVRQWWLAAPAQGFARRHALARAIMLAAPRPDVQRRLLRDPETDLQLRGWILDLAAARADRSAEVEQSLTRAARARAEVRLADPRQADDAIRREQASAAPG